MAGEFITVRTIGLREAHGRFASALDGGLVLVVQEQAEEMGHTLADVFRHNAPRSGKPRADHKPFADSIEGHAQRAGSGFAIEVGTDQGGLARWIRDGTREHEIVGHPFLAFEIDGELIIRRHVHHPGTKPNPWEARARLEAEPLITFMGNRIGMRMAKMLSGGIGTATEAA